MYIVTIKDYPNGHGKPKQFKSRVQVFHYLRKRVCAKFSDRENYTSWKRLVLTENNFSWYGFNININKERANV
tara:strand:+ start:219 stop:437 length:219 start_codon:yes stop_codon:yes gene_type:complete